MDSIKKNLTNIVVIIGLIGSIGAGFTKFAKMESTIEQLATQTAPDLTGIETNGFGIIDNTTAIAVIEEKVSALENMDTSHTHNTKHSHDNSAVKVLEKEIELLKLQIEEIKVKSSNPLGN
jgi:hypothetical protein